MEKRSVKHQKIEEKFSEAGVGEEGLQFVYQVMNLLHSKPADTDDLLSLLSDHDL